MTEVLQANPNLTTQLQLTEPEARVKIDQTLAEMSYYDPKINVNMGIPGVGREVEEFMSTSEPLDKQLLFDYAQLIKSNTDAMELYRKATKPDYAGSPNYFMKLETLASLQPDNLRTLYHANGGQNPLTDMIKHQFHDKETNSGAAFTGDAVKLLKKVWNVDTLPELILEHPEDPALASLAADIRNSNFSLYSFHSTDVGNKRAENGLPTSRFDRGSREQRVWMRDAMRVATGIVSPEEADAYTYSSSRDGWGTYKLDTLAERIKSFGAEKLAVVHEFANIDALASFDDIQLERMYKLATDNKEEIERLKQHDVIAVLINRDGDHNGISSEIAARLDDDAGRTLFFEVNHPKQIYGDLKKLHDLGILPTTLIICSHGSAGQFFISERPSIDSDQTTDHVTLVIDQELADHQTAKAQAEGEKVVGYDIAKANGLIRSIQRFMQPSRGIDDPNQDIGRKKIISLSCEFDRESRRASLGEDGEVVKGNKTTLLRRLGEVLIDKLAGEHIDIYGADISTNQQLRTARGFHYNTIRDGRWSPYHASVLHIDEKKMQWHRLNEVQLRKG